MLQISGSPFPNLVSTQGWFCMIDWLTIHCEKWNNPNLNKFIQENPVLDMTMRTLLANYLNLSEPSLQHWIHEYQHGTSKHLQSYNSQAGRAP